jgi:hypothetical protein
MEFVVPQEVAFGDGQSLAAHTERLTTRYVEHVDGMRVDAVPFHSGDLSGVLYSKLPEVTNEPVEELKTYISGRQAGYINFIHAAFNAYLRYRLTPP